MLNKKYFETYDDERVDRVVTFAIRALVVLGFLVAGAILTINALYLK